MRTDDESKILTIYRLPRSSKNRQAKRLPASNESILINILCVGKCAAFIVYLSLQTPDTYRAKGNQVFSLKIKQ